MNFLFRRVAIASLTLVLCMVFSQNTFTHAEDSVPTEKKNLTSRIARISLESKVLDMGEKFYDDTVFLPSQTIIQEAESSANNSSPIRKKKTGKKIERSGRRLSNIWSMFLPSSSNNEDYEDTSANTNGEDPVIVEDSTGSSDKESKNTTIQAGELDRRETTMATPEFHEEKLVAKYTRPLKFESQHQLEPLNQKIGLRVQPHHNQTAPHLSPMMASASSSTSTINVATSQVTDMNDIMSNIMNSMNSPALSNSQKATQISHDRSTAAATADSVEREDDSLDGSVNNKTREGDLFERWLNKIKFRESQREGVILNSTVTQEKKVQEPNLLRLDQSRKGEHNSNRVSFSVERKQDQNPGVFTKTNPHSKTTSAKAPVHQFARLRQSPGQQVAAAKLIPKLSAPSFNQPYAQASTATIEINADDNSTALINNKYADITGNLTEVTSEQSLLQSQDEILKQVTNAINFEQQQLNTRRENLLKNNSPQEELASNSSSGQDDDSQLNSFKMFRVGTSLNELIDGTDRTLKPKLVSTGTNGTTVRESSEANVNPSKSASNVTEIKETIRTLTDKLRNLGGTQTLALEKQLSSEQPMWLQHKLHLNNNHFLKSNMSKLASIMEESNESKFNKTQLDQLRELVEKHERTKNELKSSQETMYRFLKQFMGSDASGKLLSSQDATTLLNNLTGFIASQKSAVQPHLGWTPMTLSNQEPTLSLDRLHGRVKGSNLIRINQLKDNIGVGDDQLDKENYMNDLSNFYKEFQTANNFQQHQPSDSLHAMTLGDKGEVNDEESGQLELAAHQLVGHNKLPSLRPRFKVDSKAQLSQQKLVSLAESMLEDSKIGGRFSPKHFMSGRKRHHLPPLSNLANLMQTTDSDTDHQIPERPRQQTEEPFNTHDPMFQQTSKLSSEASSETLRQKDSAALVTRTRLGPQMMTQLSLPIGPPTKLQISLDATANQTPVASAKIRLPSQFAGSGISGSFVTPDMAHDAGLRAPIVAANLPANNLPVRFRELSIYRPFGYESHHAIAYQASPAIAALFPGFAQSTRPSMLRHMTPFRAIQTQRGLINPIMPAFQVVDNTVANNPTPPAVDQFQQTASMSTQSLPVNGASRIRQGFGSQFAGSSLLKRQSHRTKTLANRWPTIANHHLGVDQQLMQTRMKMRRNAEEDEMLRYANHAHTRAMRHFIN